MVTSKKLLGEHDSFQSDEPVNVDASMPAVTSSSTSSGSPIDDIVRDVVSIRDLLVPASETVTYAGSGLVFVNQYGNGVSADFRDATVKAENFFQSHFSNSVTLDMSFDLQKDDRVNKDGSYKFSGSNNYNPVQVTYADLKNALTAHAMTADDRAAVSSLPATDPSGGQSFDVAVGMARILGLAKAGSGIDDTIVLNSNLKWTFGDDAVGVLEHEISEGGMGRVGALATGSNGDWAPMDLFRYSAAHFIYADGIPILLPIPDHDYTGGKDGQATYFPSMASPVTSSPSSTTRSTRMA